MSDLSDLEKLRADVLDAFPVVMAEVEKDLGETRNRMVADAREQLAFGRYYVVTCGEFRRGKSSLLNALVERRGLFPVDVAITTSAVITLQWAPTDQAVLYFIDDPEHPESTPEPQEIPFSEVRGYVTEQGNPGNHKNVARIEMTAPIPQLETGLVLVDTPGVGSVNVAHTAVTRAFLPNADAILFVAMATEPLSTLELDFLKFALEQSPALVTAITMIDRVVDATPVIEQARSRIAQTSGAKPEDLIVVGVSSLRKLNALESGDPGMLVGSGFPELEWEIWHGLAISCGRVKIESALDALEAALADAAAPLANEFAALKDDKELQRVESELRAAQERSKELTVRGSRWRSDLKEQLEVAVRPVHSQLSRDFDDVRENFRRGLQTDRAINDPDSLAREVSNGLVDAVNRANQGLGQRASEVADRFSKETATKIAASSVSPDFLPPERDLGSAPSGAGASGWSKFRTTWGGGLAGGGAGAIVGAAVGSVFPVVGTFLGAVVGGVIGQVFGWFRGGREARRLAEERQQREQIAHLRTEVTNMIDSSRRQAERDFGNQVTDCTRAMTKALEDQIAAALESQQESVRRLADLKKRTAQQRAERSDMLHAQADRYSALLKMLTALRDRVGGLGRR